MSESSSTDCQRFEEWLTAARLGDQATDWQHHLATCPECDLQWRMHRVLNEALGEEPVPELSPRFLPELERRIEADVEVRPLNGWRTLALGGYAAAAVALMSWILERYPLPDLSIDPSSLWFTAFALAAAPLTLLMAAAAARYLPQPKGDGPKLLSL